MKCLYCDKPIDKISFRSIFLKDDDLCPECRGKLKPKRTIVKVEEMEVETFYEYDGMYKSLLLQYKECLDEALKKVFLYELSDYINMRYHGYLICFVPSSKEKLESRGFSHLKLMFEEVKLKQLKGLRMKEELCQEGMDLDQRKRMLNNFVYEGKQADRVLLVDDVLTSGSTLLGAYRALLPKVTKIKVLSIAYRKNGNI